MCMFNVNVISCPNNPEKLLEFGANGPGKREDWSGWRVETGTGAEMRREARRGASRCGADTNTYAVIKGVEI